MDAGRRVMIDDFWSRENPTEMPDPIILVESIEPHLEGSVLPFVGRRRNPSLSPGMGSVSGEGTNRVVRTEH